jgi:hypothetical protein
VFSKRIVRLPPEIGFASDFVMELVFARYEELKSIKFENALYSTEDTREGVPPTISIRLSGWG